MLAARSLPSKDDPKARRSLAAQSSVVLLHHRRLRLSPRSRERDEACSSGPPGLDNGWREVSWRFLQKNIEGYALLRLQLMNSNLPPAVGTNAATEIKWGFGTSRWQLGYQPTSGRSRGKRVNVAYWPITTLSQEFHFPQCSESRRTRADANDPERT